jgi:hypothetical protein
MKLYQSCKWHFLLVLAVVYVGTSVCLQDKMTAVHTNNNIYWNGYMRASRGGAIDIRITKQLQSCGLHSRFLCRDCFVFEPEPYCLPYALLYFHALKLTHHMQLKGVPLGNTNQDMFYAYEDNVEMYGSASWELIALKQTIKRDDIYVRIARGEHDVMKDPLCTGDHEHYYLYNTADSTLTRDSSTQRLFQHMREQYNSKQCLLQN